MEPAHCPVQASAKSAAASARACCPFDKRAYGRSHSSSESMQACSTSSATARSPMLRNASCSMTACSAGHEGSRIAPNLRSNVVFPEPLGPTRRPSCKDPWGHPTVSQVHRANVCFASESLHYASFECKPDSRIQHKPDMSIQHQSPPVPLSACKCHTWKSGGRNLSSSGASALTDEDGRFGCLVGVGDCGGRKTGFSHRAVVTSGRCDFRPRVF